MHNLYHYIQNSGETQADFAARVGCAASHLSDILSGRRRPSIDLAFRIETETGGAVLAKSFWRNHTGSPASTSEAS